MISESALPGNVSDDPVETVPAIRGIVASPICRSPDGEGLPIALAPKILTPCGSVVVGSFNCTKAPVTTSFQPLTASAYFRSPERTRSDTHPVLVIGLGAA